MKALGATKAVEDAGDFADFPFVQYPLAAHEAVDGGFKDDGLAFFE